MASESGPFIVKDGLVMSLDAGNERSFRGEPTTNTVTYPNTGANRYNNPGFSGGIVNTGQTFLGSPVWEVTFIPQDTGRIPRLASTEGFGFFHGFGTRLFPNTNYMASVYFRTDYPLQNSASQGFSHGYSNIPGWSAFGTSTTRLQEGSWTRLYSRYSNTTVVDGVNYSTRSVSNVLTAPVNTTALQQVLITITIQSNGTFSVSTDAGNTSVGTITDFANHAGVISASPSITNAGGIVGLSTGTGAIVNHGLDTSTWTKLSTSNFMLKTSYPFTYYVLVNVPSTSGANVNIQLNLNFNGIYFSLSDNKFWKVTFNTSNLQVNDVIRTYWAAPMIEEHTRTLPSRFVIGTRGTTVAGGGGWADLSNNNNHGEVLNAVGYNSGNGGSWVFDGVDDTVNVTSIDLRQDFTFECWVLKNVVNGFAFLGQGTTSTRSGLHIWFNNATSLRFGMYSNDTDATSLTTATGVWYHYCFTYNHSTFVKQIFRNGILLNGVPVQTQTSYLGTGTLRLGATYSSGGQYANGRFASAKIYNRVLSPQEIRQNFISTRRRFGL